MKCLVFSRRTAKEILRDPVNLGFGLGFPLVLLGLLSVIQANIPVSLFAIDRLAPGIAVFGLSFLTLFTATLVSRDRESAFLQRLYTTPMQGNVIKLRKAGLHRKVRSSFFVIVSKKHLTNR